MEFIQKDELRLGGGGSSTPLFVVVVCLVW